MDLVFALDVLISILEASKFHAYSSIPHVFTLVVVLFIVVVIVVDVDLKSNSLVIINIDMIRHLTKTAFTL